MWHLIWVYIVCSGLSVPILSVNMVFFLANMYIVDTVVILNIQTDDLIGTYTVCCIISDTLSSSQTDLKFWIIMMGDKMSKHRINMVLTTGM